MGIELVCVDIGVGYQLGMYIGEALHMTEYASIEASDVQCRAITMQAQFAQCGVMVGISRTEQPEYIWPYS